MALLENPLPAAEAGYDSAVDCWAVGCIIFELLAGHPPFQAADESVLFYKARTEHARARHGSKPPQRPSSPRQISENALEFPKDVFPDDSAARALILALTATDPAQRMTCAQALRHPWMAERDAACAQLPDRSSARAETRDRRSLSGASPNPFRGRRSVKPAAAEPLAEQEQGGS